MKRMNIIILVGIAIAIGVLVSLSVDFSTYDTISSAKQKPGKFVHVVAKLDTSSIIYDPAKDPNFLSFYATDTVGVRAKVIYRKTKPQDLEKSARIVLQGRMQGDIFECKDILLKCPSKYKDDKEELKKTVAIN